VGHGFRNRLIPGGHGRISCQRASVVPVLKAHRMDAPWLPRPGALLCARDDGGHHVAVAVECVIYHRDGSNLAVIEPERLRVKAAETRLMNSARSAARRRMAQMFEGPGVFVERGWVAQFRENVIDGNAGKQGIV